MYLQHTAVMSPVVNNIIQCWANPMPKTNECATVYYYNEELSLWQTGLVQEADIPRQK